jgi:hypothetical protein
MDEAPDIAMSGAEAATYETAHGTSLAPVHARRN